MRLLHGTLGRVVTDLGGPLGSEALDLRASEGAEEERGHDLSRLLLAGGVRKGGEVRGGIERDGEHALEGHLRHQLRARDPDVNRKVANRRGMLGKTGMWTVHS
eukprot:2040256-Rhodomonas_salina.3